MKLPKFVIFISVSTVASTITLETTEAFHAISSPNYPEDYPSLQFIRFIIISPEDSSIELNILDLSVQPGCINQILEIYDGKYMYTLK